MSCDAVFSPTGTGGSFTPAANDRLRSRSDGSRFASRPSPSELRELLFKPQGSGERGRELPHREQAALSCSLRIYLLIKQPHEPTRKYKDSASPYIKGCKGWAFI